MLKKFIIFIALFFLKTFASAQGIVCPSNLIYICTNASTGTNILVYDPSLPFSSSNPTNSGIPMLTGGSGLALLPNISGGFYSPTFYTTYMGNYYYWDGSNWFNTGNSTGSTTAVNLGGCGSMIYNISYIGSPTVFSYNGTTNGSSLVTVPGSSAADIVVDCNCNFYVLTSNSTSVSLIKYSPTGSVLTNYSVSGIPSSNVTGGAGMAIIGNDVYFQGSVVYKGTIGSSSAITFSAIPNSSLSAQDWASCPADVFIPPTGTLNFSGSLCSGQGSITANITGSSPFTYMWSGPGITSPITGSVITPAGSGIYTCTAITSNACSTHQTNFTTSINYNSCITVASTSITCANLGSATVNPVGGVGPFSFLWTPGAQTSSVASGLSPGSYTISVFDFGTNFTYTASTLFLPLVPLTATISASASLSCSGLNTGTASVISLSGGSGNHSFFWTNGTTSFTTSSIFNLSSGSWSIAVTDALTGCQASQNFSISQPPSLNLTIISSGTNVCLGESIVLNAVNSGGTPFGSAPFYNCSWGNNSLTAYESTSGTYVYSVSTSDANNCLITGSIAINFVGNPTITVSNVSICPLATGVLTVTGATSYSWSNNTVGNILTDNPLTSTQYTVIGSALGCTSSALASIFLKQAPIVLITSNSPKCNGDDLSLTGFGANTFLWSGPNNFTSAAQTPTLTNVGLSNAGVYTLLVTAANSCTNSTTHTVIVFPSPTLSVLGSTVCTSQTLNLLSSSNGTSYAWSGPQNFNSTLQNAFINSPLIANSGTYTLKVTSAQGCTNSAFAVASVIPPPSLTSSLSSNGTLCAQALNGSPNTITLTSGGANTYTLFTPYHISNQNSAGPSYSMSSLPPYITGPATATLMGSNGICTVSLAINFVVIPNPTLAPLSPTPIICAGETFTYTSNGASSYTWGPGSPNLTTYTGPATVASPTQTSVYSVVGGSLGCNSGTQTSTITVRPLPQFSINPIKPEICLNEKINLNAIGNAESYTWSPYNGLSSMNGFTVSAGPLAQQTYTVLGVFNTCTSTAMITVSVLPLPNPVASVTNDKLCVNGLVSLQGSGGLTYTWEGPQDLKLGGQTATFVASSVNYSGTYNLIVTDSNGCKNKTSIDLTIYNLPNGDLFTDKQEACVPFKSEFKSSFSTVNVVGNWVLENKTYATKNFSHTFTNPGTYVITGNFKDTLTSCVSSNTFVVKANPNPVADFSILPEKPIENLEEVIFTNISQGDQQTKWNWYFVNNQGYQSQNENTSYLFTDAGLYPVVMVVANTWGCSDTIIKTIKVESDLAVYVPNVFTPNGDELNDVFIPVTRAIDPDRHRDYELAIFDRWGARVFSTTNTEAGWDGTFKGELCKTDVYVWKIVLSSVNGEMKTLTGHVTLSR